MGVGPSVTAGGGTGQRARRRCSDSRRTRLVGVVAGAVMTLWAVGNGLCCGGGDGFLQRMSSAQSGGLRAYTKTSQPRRSPHARVGQHAIVHVMQ